MPQDYMDKDFFTQVHELVRLIPKGRVTTYGAIAKCLGMPRSARMVGWAMNQSHDVIPLVPAHRVVNRAGMLSGKMHFGHPDEMQRRLEAEGIQVLNNCVQDFQNLFWDPWKELENLS